MEATSFNAFSDIMKTSVVSTPAGLNMAYYYQCQARLIIKENKKIYILTLYILRANSKPVDHSDL